MDREGAGSCARLPVNHVAGHVAPGPPTLLLPQAHRQPCGQPLPSTPEVENLSMHLGARGVLGVKALCVRVCGEGVD